MAGLSVDALKKALTLLKLVGISSPSALVSDLNNQIQSLSDNILSERKVEILRMLKRKEVLDAMNIISKTSDDTYVLELSGYVSSLQSVVGQIKIPLSDIISGITNNSGIIFDGNVFNVPQGINAAIASSSQDINNIYAIQGQFILGELTSNIKGYINEIKNTNSTEAINQNIGLKIDKLITKVVSDTLNIIYLKKNISDLLEIANNAVYIISTLAYTNQSQLDNFLDESFDVIRGLLNV